MSLKGNMGNHRHKLILFHIGVHLHLMDADTSTMHKKIVVLMIHNRMDLMNVRNPKKIVVLDAENLWRKTRPLSLSFNLQSVRLFVPPMKLSPTKKWKFRWYVIGTIILFSQNCMPEIQILKKWKYNTVTNLNHHNLNKCHCKFSNLFKVNRNLIHISGILF